MTLANNSTRAYRYVLGEWQVINTEIVTEASIGLTVNGEFWLTMMCTPIDLEALAVGFLFNEGVLEFKSDLADVRVCPAGDNVDVWLHHSVEKPQSWRRTSGCSGGFTTVNYNLVSIPVMDGVALTPQAIMRLVDHLFEAQNLYRITGGVHTSALSDGKQILIAAEDIGRHNTLDKIAGLSLLNGIAPNCRILLTTGRVSSDMLQKSARIGASVVISRTSPSTLSIEIAERLGLTLIGYARRDRFNVYTHANRILLYEERESRDTGSASSPDLASSLSNH